MRQCNTVQNTAFDWVIGRRAKVSPAQPTRWEKSHGAPKAIGSLFFLDQLKFGNFLFGQRHFFFFLCQQFCFGSNFFFFGGPLKKIPPKFEEPITPCNQASQHCRHLKQFWELLIQITELKMEVTPSINQ
jgi:hypothetical protein